MHAPTHTYTIHVGHDCGNDFELSFSDKLADCMAMQTNGQQPGQIAHRSPLDRPPGSVSSENTPSSYGKYVNNLSTKWGLRAGLYSKF